MNHKNIIQIKVGAQYLRPRYKKDLKSNSHGVLKGTEGDSPAVQLNVIDSSQCNNNFFILCDLYNRGEDGEYYLSADFLIHKSDLKMINKNNEKDLKYNNENNNDISFKPILKQINSDGTFELKDYLIVKTLAKEIDAELQNKIGLLNEYQHFNYEACRNANRNLADQSIFLGYTVFKKLENNGWELYAGPHYDKMSPSIKICRLCNTSGSVDGGYDVTILVDGINAKSKVKINIYQLDNNDARVPISTIENDQIKEIFKNCALTFKMPKYTNLSNEINANNSSQIKCFIEIENAQGEESYPPIEFIYNNTETDPKRKQPRRATDYMLEEYGLVDDFPSSSHSLSSIEETARTTKMYTDSVETTTVRKTKLFTDSIPSKKISQSKEFPWTANVILYEAIEKITAPCVTLMEMFKINDDYIKHKNSGNTLFHDAIANGVPLDIFKLFLKEPKLLEEAINYFDENLLHYACKLNKPDYIETLLNANCSIIAQDVKKLTPLQVACALNHNECIKEFITAVKDSKYSEQFLTLLDIYDILSYTIIHHAVEKNCLILIEALLKFGKEHNIDLCKIRVLTNGDNILHLAAKHNLYDMSALILKYLPQACSYENYAGLTAFDIDEMEPISDISDDEIDQVTEKCENLNLNQ